MAKATTTTTKRPEQPTEPVRRRPTDVLWFAVLFLSIATGLGMTIFAPVGDEPPPVPPSATTVPFDQPATASLTPTTTATQPATAPAL